MKGVQHHDSAAWSSPWREPTFDPARTATSRNLPISLGHTLILIMIGASLGVFWAEIFNLMAWAIHRIG